MLNSCEVPQRLLYELIYPTAGGFFEQDTQGYQTHSFLTRTHISKGCGDPALKPSG